MSEMPDAFRSITRKARKDHRCCECRSAIKTGEKYRYISGVWDGQGRSFKQCIPCHDLMEKLANDAPFPEEAPCFGDLRECIVNCDLYELPIVNEADFIRLNLDISDEEK